jgi:hypothetical protein
VRCRLSIKGNVDDDVAMFSGNLVRPSGEELFASKIDVRNWQNDNGSF